LEAVTVSSIDVISVTQNLGSNQVK
jgi:hypothetical protein